METTGTRRDVLQESLLTIRQLKQRLREVQGSASEPVAVVGMACHFPGDSDTPEQFWDLLSAGGEGMVDFPDSRRGIYGGMEPMPGNFLRRDLAEFDARFFRMSPAEANFLDPQQRQLLEVCWEALENAGLNPQTLRGSRTGVFVGIPSNCEYLMLPRDESKVNQYNGTGTTASTASGRISYEFGWNGPALSIDTACSSSLVSTHLAVNALRRDECEMAVAGGVSLMLSPYVMAALHTMNAVSADGRSRPFDAAADGYGRGEGCGLVVLKRLSDAERDGDTVHAVILGGAVNNDGASGGLTVPNGKAQRDVVAAALRSAAVAPRDVGYVETHGTGTPLGDPIEIRALTEVFGGDRDEPLLLGALKGNIGHLESAAGVAGLIKTVLCLRNGEIPGVVNNAELNPRIDLTAIPATLPRDTVAWPASEGRRRVAGISSFGFSGTNCHLVVAEPPARPPARPAGGKRAGTSALCLSAKDENALVELVRRYDAYLTDRPRIDVEQLCQVANVCRPHFMHRAVFVADTVPALHEQIRATLAEATGRGSIYAGPDRAGLSRILRKGLSRTRLDVRGGGSVYTAKVADQITPKLAFVFDGEGDDLRAVARDLAAAHPLFRQRLGGCLELFAPAFGPDFVDACLAEPDGVLDAPAAVGAGTPKTAEGYRFAICFAAVELLDALGVRPEIVTGSGSGRVLAGVVAGVMGVEDAVALLTASPKANDAAALRERLHAVTWRRPKRRLVSAVTGAETRRTDADFWLRELTDRADPAAARQTLYEQGYAVVVEFGRAGGDEPAEVTRLPLAGEGSAADRLVHHLAALTCLGANVRWDGYYAGRAVEKLILPNYPFTRSRYWFTPADPAATGVRALPAHGLDGTRLDLPAGPTHYEYVVTPENFRELADNSGVLHVGYYLEMLLHALRQWAPNEPHRVETLEFVAALRVVTGETARVCLALERRPAGEIGVRFFSRSDVRDSWMLHVHGSVTRGSGVDAVSHVDGETEVHDADAFYGALETLGLTFGRSVRWVASARPSGDGALLRFRAADPDDHVYTIGMHPGVMDGCAQAFNFLAQRTGAGKKYMIRSIAGVTVADEPGTGPLTAAVTLDGPPVDGEIAGAVTVRDTTGRVVAAVERAVLKEFDEARLDAIRLALEASAAGASGGERAFLLRYAQTPDVDKPALLVTRVQAVLAEALEESDPATLDTDVPLPDLGIDSLNGLRFFNRIRAVFGVDLSMGDLIDASTIKGVAVLILRELPGGDDLAPERVEVAPRTGRDLWIYGPEPAPEAKVRLFCFPHGFGSAGMYEEWQKRLGAGVDVCPVKLPGLDVERLAEATPHDIDELMVTMEDVIGDAMPDLPIAAFGHSWGSLFAYRLAHRLARNPKLTVAGLFVSGYTAPVLPNTSAVRIIEELEGLGFDGIPTYEEVTATKSEDAVVLAFIRAWEHESEFVEFALEGSRLMLPSVLAAYRLVERFTFDPAERFPVPIVGFHGLDDNRVTLDEMTAWERVTTGPYIMHTLAGDHGFVDTTQSEDRLLELVGAQLASWNRG